MLAVAYGQKEGKDTAKQPGNMQKREGITSSLVASSCVYTEETPSSGRDGELQPT